MTLKPRLSLAVIAAAAMCASCGSGKPEAAVSAQATGAAARAQAPAAPAKKKNACAFVPLPMIEEIAKEQLTLFHNIQEEEMSVCEVISKTKNTIVTVTVYWAGGKEVARTNQAAMSMARQMLNEDDVDIEELTGSAKVRGLADKAYYSDVMPSWFLKGDVLVEVVSPLFRHEQTKAVFTAIAKQAIPLL